MVSDFDMDKLLCRFFAGEATPEEAMFLEDWKTASADNQRYFDGCCRIFGHPVLLNENKEKNKIWNNISNNLNNITGRSRVKKIRTQIAVAASVILVITISAIIYRSGSVEKKESIYTAGITGKKIRLKDASEIMLSPGARLIVADEKEGRARKIKLEGSAFFSVQHGSLHPLVVETGSLYVKDIGTRFFIISGTEADTIIVKVEEGRVSVYDDHGSRALISAGEKISYVQSLKKLETFLLQKPLPYTDLQVLKNKKGEKPENAYSAVADTGMGTVVFECTMCAGKGQLQFIHENVPDTLKINFMFSNTSTPGLRRHRTELRAGTYRWSYNDGIPNRTSGKLTVIGGKEQTIRLFGPGSPTP